MLVLREKDLVKALGNRKFQKVCPQRLSTSTNRLSRWEKQGPRQKVNPFGGHSASDGEQVFLLHDIKGLRLLGLEEPVRKALCPCPTSLQAFQESHSGSPSPGDSISQGFPNVQSQLLCQVKPLSLPQDSDRIPVASLPLLNLPSRSHHTLPHPFCRSLLTCPH